MVKCFIRLPWQPVHLYLHFCYSLIKPRVSCILHVNIDVIVAQITDNLHSKEKGVVRTHLYWGQGGKFNLTLSLLNSREQLPDGILCWAKCFSAVHTNRMAHTFWSPVESFPKQATQAYCGSQLSLMGKACGHPGHDSEPNSARTASRAQWYLIWKQLLPGMCGGLSWTSKLRLIWSGACLINM